MGTIFNIQRYCLHDGDGIRTTVFFKGCPLKCVWCHNPEGLSKNQVISFSKGKCSLCGQCLSVCSGRTIDNGVMNIPRDICITCSKCIAVCPNGANELVGKEVTPEEVIREVERDKAFYKTSGGGMTLSGGEPSFQAEFALELVTLAKERGISTFIETCGFGQVGFYDACAKQGCTFLYDIKCVDPAKHKALTGVDNKRIFDNLFYLFSKGADIIIRLPLVPTVNDSHEDIAALCSFLREHSGSYRYCEIMPYHALGVSKGEKIGREVYYAAENAGYADKERWRKQFASFGVEEVRIS